MIAGMMRRILGSDGSARDASDDRWYADNPVTPDGQILVNARTIMQIPEAYACVMVLSQTIGSLPLITYRKTSSGGKERFDRHPVADLLHHRPNAHQTAFEFRGQMTIDLVLHRNAFAEIKDGRRGPIDTLERLDPEMVWVVTTDGGHVYEVREAGKPTRRLLPEQVFHLRAPPLMRNNILGRSLIEDGAKAFARALALQDYATRFFENDATPGGVVTLPGKFATIEQAQEFKRKWAGQFTGRNRHKMGVLDNGATFHKIDIQNDKAQFIETSKEVALQIVRLWRVPPHKIGILDRATFSNIESQSLEFVTDTLLPWLVAWEQGIRRDLIVRDDIFLAEHNVEGLLRGDIKSRYDAYRVGREGGWLTVNDILRRENMNPVQGGDTYLRPLNMTEAGPQPGAQPGSAAPAAIEDRVSRVASLVIEDMRIEKGTRA